MIRVGLTGGIGSGKSTVARLFAVFAIPVFSSDEEGRRLMNEDEQLIAAIRELLGPEVYIRTAEGLRPDRKKIAGIVFNDTAKLEGLNALVHPAVIHAFDEWATRQSSPYVVKESALLFESDAWKHCDLAITVTAPLEERVRRVMQRDRLSSREVRRRMAFQLPETEKVSRADFVFKNDNRQLLIPQVYAIHQLLMTSPQDPRRLDGLIA